MVKDSDVNQRHLVQVLALVALHALGPDNCLLHLRVCRGVCKDLEISTKRKLSRRRAPWTGRPEKTYSIRVQSPGAYPIDDGGVPIYFREGGYPSFIRMYIDIICIYVL